MVQELLICPFDSDILDKSGRHTLHNINGVVIGSDSLGVLSATFNGVSYLTTAPITNYLEDGSKGFTSYTLSSLPNADDFLLGSTKYINPYVAGNFEVVFPDSNFTIDAWVYLRLGGPRYYPICSSYAIGYNGLPLKIGWVLQVDTASGHLQMIGYRGGIWTNCILESSLQVPVNQWVQIVVMAKPVTDPDGSELQAIYINGKPDHSSRCYYSLLRLGNGYFPDYNTSNYQYAAFYVGLGPKSQYTNPGQNWLFDINPYNSNYFRGSISNLQVCLGQRYSVSNEYPRILQAYVPVGNYPSSTSTSSTTTTTTTTTSPITWTSTTSTGLTTATTGTSSTGTTVTYTTTTSWTTSTISYTTMTPVPIRERISIEGVPSSSRYFTGYGSSNAFDANTNTYWMCSPYEVLPYWIAYTWASSSYIVDEYQVYFSTTGNPKSWNLQGSNNGSTWITLDTRSSISETGLLTYHINNVTAYSHYRLYITEIWSQSHGVKVHEFALYANSTLGKPDSQMHWVGYDFGTPILAQRYCMKTLDGYGFNRWKLQGSHDGIFWVDVDYQDQPDWVGWKCVEIEDNELYFPRWRLLVMNWDDLSNPGLIEFEIFRRT